MGILGIENRTENWRTARVLSPLVKEESSARVSLASHLVGSREQLGDNIEFELFWRGMRDYMDQRKRQEDPDKGRYEDLVLECYRSCFSHLRQKVECFSRFQDLKPHNYVADKKYKKKLYKNLLYTEVDIVLQTPRHLCIGEAKWKSPLDAKSDYVLVHQLLRQYVMARVLVALTDSHKDIIPFVVGDFTSKPDQQVKFMLEMGYLRERNVLSWKDLSKILGTEKTSPCGQDMERRFNDLAEQWKSETAHQSLMSNIVLHRSYQEIIGLGHDVLPLILKNLSVEPNHWFWALRAISGEDPVPAGDVGRFDAMRNAWLEWGRNRGLMQ